jgi:hypothetical protein
VLVAVNTRLRPDASMGLELCGLTVVDDEDLGKTILEIEACGKRGVGYCETMPVAVRRLQRLRCRPRPARVYGLNTGTGTSVTLRCS